MGHVATGSFEGDMGGASMSRVGGLGKRALSAAVLLPIFLAVVMGAPGWLFAAVVVLVAALAQWELSGMFARGGIRSARVAAMIGGSVVTASFAVPVPGVPMLALTAVVLALLAASVHQPGGAPIAWEPFAIAVFGVAYVNWLLGYGIWLRALDGGVQWVLLLVWVTWLGETAAYVVGSLLGRIKLAPVVSPKKTIEGAVAQLVVSVLAAAVAQAWFVDALSAWQAAIVGAILGIVGQIGDLAESVLKRSVGTKDAGQLIPGHGGILDRIDGLLFNAPVLFYCAAWARGVAA
jgi:phosphatidate cytidylyltransferase